MISQPKIATFHKHVHYHYHGQGFDSLNKQLISSRLSFFNQSFREGININYF